MRQPTWQVLVLACALVACGDNNFPAEPDAQVVIRSLDTLAPAQVKAGDPINVMCILTENDVPTMVTGQIKVTDEANVKRLGTSIVASKVSTVTVECSLPELELLDETPASVEIVVGDPATVVTTITPDPVTAGETATATCTVFDGEGNEISGLTPALVLSPSDPGNVITDLTAVMTRAGSYAALCSLPGAQSNNAPFDVIPALPSTLLLAKLPNTTLHGLGELVKITHVVADRFGNEIVDAVVDFASNGITGSGPIVKTPPNEFRYNGEGRYRVTGTVSGPTHGGTPVTAQLELLVNSVGPRIQCTGDATMINLTPGAPLPITGTANDVNGVASLAVNGTNVTVGASNSFSTTVTSRFGLNFVDVTAVDDFGATTSKVCTYLVSNRWAPGVLTDGISLKLTQNGVDDAVRTDGLDSFADILHAMINSAGLRNTIHSALIASPILKPSTCDSSVFGVCLFRSEIIYRDAAIDGPNTVSLTLVNGGLRVSTRINNIGINLRIRGHVSGINYDTMGWVRMSYVDVGVILDTTLVAGRPRLSVRAGSVTTAVGSISTDFNGLDGWLINNVVVPLAQGSLRNTVRDMLRDFVTDNFNQVLDSVISGLDVSTLGTTFNVPKLDGGGTVALGFGIGFTTLATTTSRLLFGIGTTFSSTAANAYATFGAALPPGVNLTDPTVSLPSNMAVGAHVGLINQALHALWKANYFTADFAGADLGLGLPTGVRLILAAKLPPVAYVNTNGSVALQLGAIEAMVTHPDLPQNLVVTLGADAHASVSLVGNDLRFTGIVIDQVYASTDDISVTAQQQSTLETLVSTVLQQLIDQSLNDALPALPIPSFPLPTSLNQYGLPGGSRLGISNPALTSTPHHFTLRGQFGSL